MSGEGKSDTKRQGNATKLKEKCGEGGTRNLRRHRPPHNNHPLFVRAGTEWVEIWRDCGLHISHLHTPLKVRGRTRREITKGDKNREADRKKRGRQEERR